MPVPGRIRVSALNSMTIVACFHQGAFKNSNTQASSQVNYVRISEVVGPMPKYQHLKNICLLTLKTEDGWGRERERETLR